MVTKAAIGVGTLLEVREGADTSSGWFELGEVVELTPPSDTVDEHEVTHLQSAGKEFIAGMSDPGEMACKVNYEAGDATDEFILAWKASRELRDTRITYVSGRTQTISTFVKTYVPDAISPNAPMTASLSLRCSGASVFAG